jgi:hypothetical protein
MRHFLRPPLAPGALPRSVSRRATMAALVARSSPLQRFAPAHRRALTRAVPITAVTVAADPHLARAASAAVEPIALLAGLHAPCTQHWTTPCGAGIKARQTRPHAREHAEGPGFCPGMCPGLRLFGVREQNNAASSAVTGRGRDHWAQRDCTVHRRLPKPTASINSTRPSSDTSRVRNPRRTLLGSSRVNPQNPADSDHR